MTKKEKEAYLARIKYTPTKPEKPSDQSALDALRKLFGI